MGRKPPFPKILNERPLIRPRVQNRTVHYRPTIATKKTDAELLGGKLAYLVANRMDNRGVRTANPLNRDVVQPPQRRLAIENRKKEITA